MGFSTPSQKNIVYGNITAGGDVHIGDITYHVSKDFNHSILFLRIEPISENNYTAQLTLKSRHLGKKGLTSTGLPLLFQPVQLDISSQLFQKVSNFQSDRRLSGTYFRKNESPTPESLWWVEQQLITSLFDTFFTGDILAVCQDFVELLEKRKIEELLLAISVDDTTIVNLPFEMVIPRFFPEKLGQVRQSLTVNHFGLVRTLEKDLDQFDMQGKAPSAAPLKMLFVTALPENMGEENKMLEIEEEQKRLIDAIGSFEATGGQPKIVIEFLDTASLAEISEALQKHQHDILHISGHGSYNSEVNQGVLHLEDEDGNHCQVLGKELGETLRQHQCVKLLILSACETAIAGNGVVEQLAEFGLPSIIAMRFSVTDMGAKIFTTALYDALSKAETLTQAIAQAREHLWAYVKQARECEPNRPHLAEWFTPVVYLNQYTGASVNLKEKYMLPEDFYPRSEFLKSKNTRLIGSGFIGRKRYLNALRRSFGKGEHICLHGLGGMGKTTLAEAFAHNYENHNHDFIIFRNGNQIAEKYILDELFARLENDETINKNTVRQIKQYLESDANQQEKLQVLIDNYLKTTRNKILLFDNFEDVQKSEEGEQQQAIGSASLAEFMTYLCQNTPPNCHLLFTTRYKIVDLAEHLTHLALDKMTYAEQYRLTNFSETLRKIPMSERQDIVKRLDGHPRAYEFLETLLKKDKTLTWIKLSTQIGEVEAKVWEDLLLEKIYQRLNPEEQQLLQVCAVFISRTPMAALEYVIEKARLKTAKLEVGELLGLCLYDNENQTFEVHRLTREWMIKNVISDIKLKEWAFLAGIFFRENNTISYSELAKNYFEISENWQDFIDISLHIQDYYQLKGFYKSALKLNEDILEKDFDSESNAYAFHNNGIIYLSLGEFDKSLINLKLSLHMSRQINDTEFEGNVLNTISQVYDAKSEYDEALTFLNQSLAINTKNNSKESIGANLNNIGRIYNFKGEYEKAISFLKQSLTIRREINDIRGESITLNNISQSMNYIGDYVLASNYIKDSLKMCIEIGDIRNEANAFCILGEILINMKNHEEALLNLNKALKIQNQILDYQGKSLTLQHLSKIYLINDDFDQAKLCLENALSIVERIKDQQSQIVILNSISQIYKMIGDIGLVTKYIMKSLVFIRQRGDQTIEAKALFNLGMAFYEIKNDFNKACSYWSDALYIQRQLGNDKDIGITLNHIGIIYFEEKKYEESVPYFFESSLIFQTIDLSNFLIASGYLGNIIEKIGQKKFQKIVSKQTQQ
jgi:tetratricopeptide (TPR) repeat protein/ABC-type dipeptide/oligopeptide/nickel transport system ATPase subunit